MSDQVEYLSLDGSEWPNFRVTTTSPPETESLWHCLVESIGAWEDDGTPVEEYIERYLTATIKWDSCSHFVFGDAEDNLGYLHICGVRYFQLHALLMKELYRMAFEHMGKEPLPYEDWT
ncbi:MULTISPECIES: hypothetical protein [Nocardia]|uniref:hypothetical protein n=1 Tax=Nocardia TaxID=1817 RepID=UPI0007A46BB6|nr:MULTISPECIES: hypothetical protein [Nocardia]